MLPCEWPPPAGGLRRGLATAGALGALLWAGCERGGTAGLNAAPEPALAAVEVVTATPRPLRERIDVPGQLDAELSVVVRPEIDGVIEAVEFREGGAVARGEALFRLRSAEQAARLREAEAELSLAEEVYRRTQRLKARDVSSAAQLDKAAAEREVARARVELARVELERTTIRAPFDGVLGARRVAPGDRVEPETDLVSIDAIDRLQLHFTLPEVAVGVVRVGAAVRVAVAPYPGERFDGEVYFVSPTLDPAARRILIKAWVPNEDHRLRPGLFAQVELEIGRRDRALALPESALLPAIDGTYVWRLGEGDVAERVAVELGLRSGGMVEIRSGLAAGDRVVATGIDKVVAGKRVRPVEAHPTEQVGGGTAGRSGS